MTIHVKLKGKTITIKPMSYDMKHGSNQIKWKLDDDSEKCDFADPPITFDDPHAPMTHMSPNGMIATCTDDNQNDTGAPISYGYQVHLTSSAGSITYPSNENPKSDGDPYIRNKPK